MNNVKYHCRYLRPDFLLNREGIIRENHYYISTVERAFADLRHVNPKFFADNENTVNKRVLRDLNLHLGYK
jgi:hypothetical protein